MGRLADRRARRRGAPRTAVAAAAVVGSLSMLVPGPGAQAQQATGRLELSIRVYEGGNDVPNLWTGISSEEFDRLDRLPPGTYEALMGTEYPCTIVVDRPEWADPLEWFITSAATPTGGSADVDPVSDCQVIIQEALRLVPVVIEPGATTRVVFAAGRPSYTDVGASNPFRGVIAWLASRSIAHGRPDGTFGPAEVLNRATFAAMLHHASGAAGDPAPPAMGPFLDVPGGHLFRPAVAWALRHGLVSGFGDGTFAPGRAVSRGEVAALLWRLAGRPSPTQPRPAISDVGSGHPFATPIAWAVQQGLVGAAGGRFDPAGTLTRADAAVVLNRYASAVGFEPV